MTDKIYNLYKRNLPDIIRSEEAVKSILEDKENHMILRSDNNTLAGVSVINKNTIYLLCVDRPFQNQGIGTDLLIQSEKYIKSNGFDKVVTGAGSDYIVPGVPMNDGAHHFFMKNGYTHSWGDCGCFDMSLLLKDFESIHYSIGDTINGITYRWAEINDLDEIIQCVADAEKDFLLHYQNKNQYDKNSDSRVLIAVKDNKVVGTLIVSKDTGYGGMGTVGCTATSPLHRNKGIATTMVKLGTAYFKYIGLDKAFLGYTYTDIVKMYGRAGYKVCMEYFMGEKII